MNVMSDECRAISRKYVESMLEQIATERGVGVPFTVYLPHLGNMVEALFPKESPCVYVVGRYRVTVVNERGSCYPPFCRVSHYLLWLVLPYTSWRLIWNRS